jgi:hypothetical protein
MKAAISFLVLAGLAAVPGFAAPQAGQGSTADTTTKSAKKHSGKHSKKHSKKQDSSTAETK